MAGCIGCDDDSTQHYRMDIVWTHLSQMRNPDNSLIV